MGDPSIGHCMYVYYGYNNICNLIFSRVTSQRERDIIKETYGDNFKDGDNFLAMLDYATAEPYGKLYVDLDNMKVYKGFTEQLYPGRFS